MSWPSTRNTRPTPPTARAHGTCCRRDRWSARRKTRREVRAYRSPLGQRLVVRGRIGELLSYTQTLTLWHGVDRVDCRHHHRRLRRGGPAAATALAVPGAGRHAGQRGRRRGRRSRFRVAAQRLWIGRYRRPAVDTGQPAYGWFGLSSALGSATATVCGRCRWPRWSSRPRGRAARWRATSMVALVRAGVTATCSGADRPRYGYLGVDSNLPDTRIVVGGPSQNAFTENGAGRRRSGLRRRGRAAACPHRPRQRCGCPPRRRWPTAGFPAPTCATRGRCRCW